jgi:hypothetical protein
MATYNQLYGTPIPDDRDMGPVLLILTSVLVSFTILTTILRIWARAKRGRLGWVRTFKLHLEPAVNIVPG